MSDNSPDLGTVATLDDLIPADEVRVALSGKRSEASAYFIFKPLDPQTLRKYRTIYNGPPGSRRGKPVEAVKWLFRSQFIRTENLDLSLNGYADESEFFLKDERGQIVVDSAINAYLSNVLPSEDDIKE